MKKILFRKLLSDYLVFLFIGLISAGIVIWIFQAVNFLDIMIEDGRDYLVYIKYSLLNFPKIISKIFPFILFFSIFYVTVKYEQKNELIIFWNFGLNKIQIVNFILKFSFLLFCFQIILNSIIVPYAQDKARSNLRSSSINFYDNFVKPKKFIDTIKGVTIYAEKKDENGLLHNLYIKKEFDENQFQITFAKKGKFEQTGKNPKLILYQGARISSQNKNITNISFSKSDFSLLNLETNTTLYKKTQEINSLKLIKCINLYFKHSATEFKKINHKIENCSNQNIQNIFKETYKRFIIPLYVPLLSIISLILLISSKESSNYQKLRVLTFLIGFLIIVFAETTIRFISKNFIQNFSLVLIPIILLILLYFFLSLKFKSKLNY